VEFPLRKPHSLKEHRIKALLRSEALALMLKILLIRKGSGRRVRRKDIITKINI